MSLIMNINLPQNFDKLIQENNTKAIVEYFMLNIKNSFNFKNRNKTEISNFIFKKNKAFCFLNGYFSFALPLIKNGYIDLNKANNQDIFNLDFILSLLNQTNQTENSLLFIYLNQLPEYQPLKKQTQETYQAHQEIIDFIVNS